MEKGKEKINNIDYSATDILYMLRDLPDACCIFEVITDPFGTVQDMRFLFVNEKYASLVGKQSSELLGSTFFNTVSNRDEDWMKLSYQAAFMRQSVMNHTFNTQYNRWFEFWAVPVYKKGFCAFIIHDVTAEKRKEENRTIDYNSTNFVLNCAKVLSTSEFRKGIKYTLKELGGVLKADRVSVIDVKQGEVGDVYQWSERINGTGLPSKKVLDEYDFFTMWESQIKEDGVAVIDDTSVLSDKNSQIYDDVLAGNISRYIVASLKDKAETIGYLLVDNYSMELDIDERTVVQSVSIFISEELKNYKLTTEVSYMNTHDDLTDLGNRYAYYTTKNMLDGLEVTVGVCFIDINGIKAINDERGHDAGDDVIKETAELIASVFKKKFCYRIGGDQFVVIVPQVSKEHFDELLEKLKKKRKKTTFAIGAVWSEESKDINNLINQADKLMSSDKSNFYSTANRRK
ncbi:PAS domain S-box-containing protein/diguanylate cyclase (GGDEF) domain-containing protein [Pseudobutyrivibrio sp. ACV-2]|uniref:sensor domain-containing diguanylate cyclase n=1 Tax=Pseudobutyrivibrio sp. ACV-2 TaxID=1520801 RepID=UPI00089D3718|nr:sensor domain-containing diguanylate cyclase [Pseudobutyrivibrio sp. ACV-2]SEA46702.1 PAS domain S-box-containing protein/diguanylate cyclase (GGDEF) domain-containing protein [Pseudobutyrivibrio sp. ACV-2]